MDKPTSLEREIGKRAAGGKIADTDPNESMSRFRALARRLVRVTRNQVQEAERRTARAERVAERE
jgi:hypothetical protein